MSSRYNYTNSWNYGYTLCPETGAQFYQPPSMGAPRGYIPRGRGGGGGRGYHNRNQGPSNSPHQQKPVPFIKPSSEESKPEKGDTEKPTETRNETPETKPEAETSSGGDIKAETSEPVEDGELVERSLEDILNGRHAVMFCNDQSKVRGLRMEWEQISETGPPHNKTFTWSLKMGDMSTMGSANNKKGAKLKAAEEMARKLDKLPKLKTRQFPAVRGGFGHPFANRGGRGGFFPGGPPRFVAPGGFVPPIPFYGQRPPMPPWGNPMAAAGQKRKFGATAEPGNTDTEQPQQQPPAPSAGSASVPVGSQSGEPPVKLASYQIADNPISKLYEFCKQRKMPEPHYETVSENVVEKRKTAKGFFLRKTEFTISVEILGKVFHGVAMTKKQAKFKASEAAWAEIGAGST